MYAPIDGLRMLAVETSLLITFTVLAFLLLHFVRQTVGSPGWLEAILARNWRAVLLVIVVALVARAAILPWVGIPQPRINDEFSYLLMGDTFAHFRLANPTPAAWPHFETFHVNLTPTYHSKYPVAQGLALGVGEIMFRQPWAGVYLATAGLCGAICWALQAFVPPGWALVGGLIAVFRFALFSYWMNSYWGGSVPALGGALALGAVVRLFGKERPERERTLCASLFALGLLILGTSRPYEGLAFALPLLLYFAYKLVRGWFAREIKLRSTALPVAAMGVVAVLLMGYYNHQTTRQVLLMPYALNERTYSSLPLFLGQKVAPQLEPRDPVFAKYYIVEAREHALADTQTLSGFMWWEIRRWWMNGFFYVGPALSFPFFLGVLGCIKRRDLWIVLAGAITTAVAVSLCVFSQFHYFAPATVTVYVFCVEGLRYLWDQRSNGARAFVSAVCLTVLAVSVTRNSAAATANITFRLPDIRTSVARQLEGRPGRHLVLVTYDMERHYPGDELVHNGADFRSEKILWARSKGAGNDLDLCSAYPDRTFWGATSDDVSFSLQPLSLCEQKNRALQP